PHYQALAVRVGLRANRGRARPQRLLGATDAEEVVVERHDPPVTRIVQLAAIQLRALEALDRLRVGRSGTPAEVLELAPASLAHRAHELRIAVTHEVQERIRFAVLLPHEQ